MTEQDKNKAPDHNRFWSFYFSIFIITFVLYIIDLYSNK